MMAVIDMGDFGGYIWTSYGIAVLCLGWLTYASYQKGKNAAKLLSDLEENQPNQHS